jgi:hypothetical protein
MQGRRISMGLAYDTKAGGSDGKEGGKDTGSDTYGFLMMDRFLSFRDLFVF